MPEFNLDHTPATGGVGLVAPEVIPAAVLVNVKAVTPTLAREEAKTKCVLSGGVAYM